MLKTRLSSCAMVSSDCPVNVAYPHLHVHGLICKLPTRSNPMTGNDMGVSSKPLATYHEPHHSPREPCSLPAKTQPRAPTPLLISDMPVPG